MVSIGTIISLAVAGAVAVGGYALFANRDKIGGALTRGVETNITAPVGDYFENLWKNIPGAVDVADAVSTSKINPATILNPLPGAYGSTSTGPQQYYPQPVPTVPNNPALPPSYTNPPASNLPGPKPSIPQPSIPKPSIPKPSTAGYYYQNFAPGGRADRQIKLKSGTADKLRGRGYDLTFLTSSQKLSPGAFRLFGQSKNYL